MQGFGLWVEIYHTEEEDTQGIMAAHIIDGLEECRNFAVQQTLLLPILDVEADCAK